jgi:hypothetical protein
MAEFGVRSCCPLAACSERGAHQRELVAGGAGGHDPALGVDRQGVTEVAGAVEVGGQRGGDMSSPRNTARR